MSRPEQQSADSKALRHQREGIAELSDEIWTVHGKLPPPCSGGAFKKNDGVALT
jgi:hypothetical protein